ncbi:MAG: DNA translocase FtsK 4TM domain-containing protein, partial [bacterium]
MPKTASEKNKKKKQNSINDELIEKRKNEIIGILIIALAILSAIALYTDTAGYVGSKLSGIYHYIIGDGSFVFPVLFLLWGITLVRLKGLRINSRLVGFLLAYICIMSIIHTYQYSEYPMDAAFLGQGGGLIGGGISYLFMGLFGYIGSFVILGAIVLIGLLLGFDVHLISILKHIRDYFSSLRERIRLFFERRLAKKREKNKANSGETVSEEEMDKVSDNTYKQYEESALFTDEELVQQNDYQDDGIDEFFAEDFEVDISAKSASAQDKSKNKTAS